MTTSTRRTYLVPTHIRQPETLLTLAGVNLSVRQGVLLLVGLALGYQCWSWVGALSVLGGPPVWQVVRWIAAAVPLLVALAFAFGRIAGRWLDGWSLVLLRYLLRPRRLVWRSVRWLEPLAVVGLVDEEGLEP